LPVSIQKDQERIAAMAHAHRWTAFVFAAIGLMTGLVGCGGEGDEASTGSSRSDRFVIVSGGQTGVYYPTAGAIAKLARGEGMQLEVQSSGGSVANARLLDAGNADFAIMQNDIAAYARGGELMFDKPIASLVGVAALYPEHVQVVARANAGIESISDLAGKRVAIGAIGSGTEANALQVLAAYGLSEEDLAKVERLKAGESRDYLQDGRVDAAFFTFGVGTASITELASISQIKLIPIEGPQRTTLLEQHPFYREAVIPAGSYGDVTPSDIPTVAVMATLVARADVADETVAKLLAGVFDHLDDFKSAHQRLNVVNRKDAQANLTLPIHPGAKAFYDAGGD
jgi:TRAP transporter TAXI family solute receptor